MSREGLTTNRPFRGSRKHILDWVECARFLSELEEVIGDVPFSLGDESRWMPRDYDDPAEARLESFGPSWLPQHAAWSRLASWWLTHRRGANTPNWDLLVTGQIDGLPGLILVEAKANWPELRVDGKALGAKPSKNSRENHEHIRKAIASAAEGWREVDPRVTLSIDSHYQLANRLAFTWKLASLGIPVVLIYLGFTGDEGIRDVGEPFRDEVDWSDALSGYMEAWFPSDLIDRRLEIRGTPAWILSRARRVLEYSSTSVTRTPHGDRTK